MRQFKRSEMRLDNLLNYVFIIHHDSIIGLSEQGHSSFNPVLLLNLRRHLHHHNEVCRVPSCAQNSPSGHCLVKRSFIHVLTSYVFCSFWFQVDIWTLDKQLPRIRLSQDLLVLVPSPTFDKKPIHIGTRFSSFNLLFPKQKFKDEFINWDTFTPRIIL